MPEMSIDYFPVTAWHAVQFLYCSYIYYRSCRSPAGFLSTKPNTFTWKDMRHVEAGKRQRIHCLIYATLHAKDALCYRFVSNVQRIKGFILSS